MRTFVILAILLGILVSATAAPVQEETRFIDAINDAFFRKDPTALIALTCFDGVTYEDKELDNKSSEYWVTQKVKSVVLKRSNNTQDKLTQTRDGITYVPNLQVSHELVVTLEGNKTFGTLTMPVGEKDGKFYLILPRPKQ